MSNWIKSFFAVDNSVNEQSVIGVFWAAVSVVLLVFKLINKETLDTELIYMTLSSSLLAFGIGGFKKV